MKIRSIEASAFRLPHRRSFKWAGLNVELGGFVLVRITTDEGLIGYGEATPLPDWGGDFGRRRQSLALVPAGLTVVTWPGSPIKTILAQTEQATRTLRLAHVEGEDG